jgi:hypothetical protein
MKNVDSLCYEKLPQLPSEIEKDSALRQIAKEENATYVDIRGLFCSTQDLCSMIRGDKLLFRDNNHLGIYGSGFVGRNLAPIINRELLLFEK